MSEITDLFYHYLYLCQKNPYWSCPTKKVDPASPKNEISSKSRCGLAWEFPQNIVEGVHTNTFYCDETKSFFEPDRLCILEISRVHVAQNIFPFTITRGWVIHYILDCSGSVLSYDCTSDCRSLRPMWSHTNNNSCLFSEPPAPTPSSFQTALTCPSVTSWHGSVECF